MKTQKLQLSARKWQWSVEKSIKYLFWSFKSTNKFQKFAKLYFSKSLMNFSKTKSNWISELTKKTYEIQRYYHEALASGLKAQLVVACLFSELFFLHFQIHEFFGQ